MKNAVKRAPFGGRCKSDVVTLAPRLDEEIGASSGMAGLHPATKCRLVSSSLLIVIHGWVASTEDESFLHFLLKWFFLLQTRSHFSFVLSPSLPQSGLDFHPGEAHNFSLEEPNIAGQSCGFVLLLIISAQPGSGCQKIEGHKRGGKTLLFVHGVIW